MAGVKMNEWQPNHEKSLEEYKRERDEFEKKKEEIGKLKVPVGVKQQMMDEYLAKLPEGETEEQFWKRMKEEMRNTPIEFVKSETMKERKYENALHYIMGVLSAGEKLTPQQIGELQTFIADVLSEPKESQQQIIRG